MKGICLAGGTGSRLFPITKGVSKQLIPIYNKPMVYYPLSVLMLAEIKDILIITTPDDAESFKKLLGDGSSFGCNFTYAVQDKPNGIAQSLIIAEDFLDGDSACLILGDNIFHGANFKDSLIDAKISAEEEGCASVFGYYVNDPERYGVACFDDDGIVTSIEEKPKEPKSNYAVVGLYFYPNDAVDKAKQLTPSARGELEITSLNQLYLDEGNLYMEILPRGFSWLDTGTFESLYDASNYIKAIENRQGLKVACLEEIAYNNEWIGKEEIEKTINSMSDNDYCNYLKKLIQ